MFRRKPTFIQKFDALIKEKGFDTISNFVDDWIVNGGTFKTIHDLVLLNDINVNKYTIWLNLRDYLTVPYDGESAFWYKWNAVAKTRRKDTIVDWMSDYGKNLTTYEISKELGVSVRQMEKLVARINKIRNKETKKFRKAQDSDGFSMTHVKEKWLKKVNEKGYKTLREAILDMINKGMDVDDMANEFEVTKRTMKDRINRANIKLTPEEKEKEPAHA